MKIINKIGILLVLLVATALAACGSGEEENTTVDPKYLESVTVSQNTDTITAPTTKKATSTVLSQTTTQSTPVTTAQPVTTQPVTTQPVTTQPVTTQTPKVKMDNITYASKFSEGLAFIQLNNNTDKTYCINKSGNIVFTLDGNYNTRWGFHNGIVQLGDLICTKEGELITAESLGGEKFLFELEEMFADGYIFVKRTSTTFAGSKDELAIYNSKFEHLVDYSESLYNTLYKVILYTDGTRKDELRYSHYYDGYLYNGYDQCFELHTGKEYSGENILFSKIETEYVSDFWNTYDSGFDGVHVYDSRSDKARDEALDLSHIPDTVYSMGEYEGGVAPIEFYVPDSNNNKIYYFSILDETGNYLFEPIETNIVSNSFSNFQVENGIYVNYENVYIEIYNSKGKIAELTLDSSMRDSYKFIISDGVIMLEADTGLGGRVTRYFYLNPNPSLSYLF